MKDASDKNIAFARIEDAIRICEKRGILKCSEFFSPDIVCAAQKMIPSGVNAFFYGGYDDAERQIFVAYPDYMTRDEAISEAQLYAAVITPSSFAKLSHKDYLGSVMSLGIERDRIGDIVADEKGAAVFCKKEIAEYISENLIKIGSGGVSVEAKRADECELPKAQFEDLKCFLSSYRLDCAVAALANISRSEAASYIKNEFVKVNHEIRLQNSDTVKIGDMISIRRHGRFILYEEGGKSKKGRTFVNVKKYK